jgi:hypothetical protein
MESNSPVQEVNRDTLTGLVQKSLGLPKLQVTAWDGRPIYGGLEFDSAIFRFKGEARDGEETIPWSLILKHIESSVKTNDPAGMRYCKREMLAYQSGLLNQLPGGNISAPACYEAHERSDGSIWIWMEDVKDEAGNTWPLSQYACVAHHLGQFNAAYLTGLSIPSAPWVAHNWLRMYVENAAGMIESIRNNPSHPVIKYLFPGNIRNHVLTIWNGHDHILQVLESLPQVLCHQDAFKRNLFTRGGRTIMIDWGYLGNAPVGAELVALVGGSVASYDVSLEQLMELERICFEGYLQGLREAGWLGNPDVVRIGYIGTQLLRYPIGGLVGEMLPYFEQEFRSNPAILNQKVINMDLLPYTEKNICEGLDLLGIK